MNDSPATIIFDFDGTIADSMQLSKAIYNTIAPEFGYRQVKDSEWEQLRRSRPQDLLREYGMTFSKMARFAFRVRKEIRGRISEIQLFNGMATVLQQLASDQYRLGIISSNAVENLHCFLTTHSLLPLFDFIWSGKNLFGKERVIKKCLKKKHIPLDRVVYVGDETRDIEAVKKVGIPMVAVTWGYNAPEMLQKLNPDVLVDTPTALYEWIRIRFSDNR